MQIWIPILTGFEDGKKDYGPKSCNTALENSTFRTPSPAPLLSEEQ